MGCGHCVPFCPSEAIFVWGFADIDRDKCKDCNVCVGYCPLGAILEGSV